MLRLARSWVPQKLSSGAFSSFCICGPNPVGDSQSYGSALVAVEPVRRMVSDESQQPLLGTAQSHQHGQHLSPPPFCPCLLLRPCTPTVGLSLWASVLLEGPWLWPTPIPHHGLSPVLSPSLAQPRSGAVGLHPGHGGLAHPPLQSSPARAAPQHSPLEPMYCYWAMSLFLSRAAG